MGQYQNLDAPPAGKRIPLNGSELSLGGKLLS